MTYGLRGRSVVPPAARGRPFRARRGGVRRRPVDRGRRPYPAGPDASFRPATVRPRAVSTPEAWRPSLGGPRRLFRFVRKERRCAVWVPFGRFKVREHERGLLFRGPRVQGRPASGPPLGLGPAVPRCASTSCRCATPWLEPQRPRRDREVGRAGRRGAGRGPEGPRARRRLGRRPRGGRAEAGPVRAVDGLPRRAGRDVRRARRALRAPGPRGDRCRRADAAALLEAVDGRGRPRRPLLQGRPPRGDARPRAPHAFWKGVARRRASSTSTCASRSWTSPARRS